MDSVSETESVVESASSRICNRIWFGYNALNFVFTFGLYIFSLVVAVPVLKNCYIVGIFVLIIGTVLGLIQMVPEFFRNFIKLEPRKTRIVNICFFSMLAIRTAWLIAATIIVFDSPCINITFAYVTIYVNWGIFLSIVVIILMIVAVKCWQAAKRRRSLIQEMEA